MFLSQVERRFVDDLEHLALVVTLTECPELLKERHAKKVLLGQRLENVTAALDQLQVSLLGVPDDIKHTMFTHPVNQPLHGEDLCGTISDLSVSDDRIELLDTENTTLKQFRRQTLLGDFEFEFFSSLFGDIFLQNS